MRVAVSNAISNPIRNNYPALRRKRYSRTLVQGKAGNDVEGVIPGQEKDRPNLGIITDGLEMPNPFVIGSGPPGTNMQV